MYVIVILCVVNVWKASKRFNNDARRIRKLQTQLNYALLIQALVPFFVIVVPFTILVGTMLTGTEKLRRFTVLSTTFLSFIPLINPICTIMIIRPYRDALFKALSAALAGFVPQLGSYFSKSGVGASDGKTTAISGASVTVANLLPSNTA
ncbi:STR-89 protein [Aphelenchoides avenae]|nr:STR-89 protein [Aphelenchus avenae]